MPTAFHTNWRAVQATANHLGIPPALVDVIVGTYQDNLHGRLKETPFPPGLEPTRVGSWAEAEVKLAKQWADRQAGEPLPGVFYVPDPEPCTHPIFQEVGRWAVECTSCALRLCRTCAQETCHVDCPNY